MTNTLIRRLKAFYIERTSLVWGIGIIENTFDELLRGEKLRFTTIHSPFNDRWFADPFILDITDTHIRILVEEYRYNRHRGNISRLTIDRATNRIIKSEPILVLKSHLSYPAIIRDGEKIYIYPENAYGGGLKLYEYDPTTNSAQLISQLSKDPIADATIAKMGENDFYMFATRLPVPHCNGNKLEIYHSSCFYKEFKHISTITLPNKTARMAGNIITHNGKLYRPAQNCEAHYGHSLSIQEISRINDNFLFTEKRSISFPPSLSRIGIHTLNIHNQFIISDFKRFKHNPIIGSLLLFLRHPYEAILLIFKYARS